MVLVGVDQQPADHRVAALRVTVKLAQVDGPNAAPAERLGGRYRRVWEDVQRDGTRASAKRPLIIWIAGIPIMACLKERLGLWSWSAARMAIRLSLKARSRRTAFCVSRQQPLSAGSIAGLCFQRPN